MRLFRQIGKTEHEWEKQEGIRNKNEHTQKVKRNMKNRRQHEETRRGKRNENVEWERLHSMPMAYQQQQQPVAVPPSLYRRWILQMHTHTHSRAHCTWHIWCCSVSHSQCLCSSTYRRWSEFRFFFFSPMRATSTERWRAMQTFTLLRPMFFTFSIFHFLILSFYAHFRPYNVDFKWCNGHHGYRRTHRKCWMCNFIEMNRT